MHSTGLGRIIWAAILLASFQLSGHDSLYNYIEIRPADPGSIEIEFTVHAAELVPGVDPNSTDLLWIQDLTDEEVETLLSHARDFVASSYLCSLPPGCDIIFPDCARLRELALEMDAPRPGCIVARATISRTHQPVALRYSSEAQKRLMLVVTSPGAFPKVHDLAPGENFEITTQ